LNPSLSPFIKGRGSRFPLWKRGTKGDFLTPRAGGWEKIHIGSGGRLGENKKEGLLNPSYKLD